MPYEIDDVLADLKGNLWARPKGARLMVVDEAEARQTLLKWAKKIYEEGYEDCKNQPLDISSINKRK